MRRNHHLSGVAVLLEQYNTDSIKGRYARILPLPTYKGWWWKQEKLISFNKIYKKKIRIRRSLSKVSQRKDLTAAFIGVSESWF